MAIEIWVEIISNELLDAPTFSREFFENLFHVIFVIYMQLCFIKTSLKKQGEGNNNSPSYMISSLFFIEMDTHLTLDM